MTYLDDGQDAPPVKRAHVIAGLVAVSLSIGLHIAAFFSLSSMEIHVPFVIGDPTEFVRRSSAMTLDTVDPQPRPDALRPALLSTSDPAFGTDLARDATALAIAPDESLMQPTPVPEDRLAGSDAGLAKPSPPDPTTSWEPRQEILAIQRETVRDEVALIPRREIPEIDRTLHARDIVLESSRKAMRRAPAMSRDVATVPVPRPGDGGNTVLGGGFGHESALLIGEPRAETTRDLFRETPEDVTPLEPIEDLLTARVAVYSTLRDLRYKYFQIQIQRAGADVLPVMPRDVVFVQDASASMTEQKLHFCREALSTALSKLGPRDRFTIVRFRDQAEFCFPNWQPVTPDSLARGQAFLANTHAGGNTDLYGSLTELLRLERQPGRAVVALLLSDGMPTTGLTESANIIGRFTKANGGALSLFAMGTVATANRYLLDLLAYSNRGEGSVVTGGRWAIPDDFAELCAGVRRPVLTDVRFAFVGVDDCEIYPGQTSNLYLDRPLVLYGRCPRKASDIVFQAVGRAEARSCDMVFRVPLDKRAAGGRRDLRRAWATQKIYTLISQLADMRSPAVFDELLRTAKDYGVKVPYRREL